MKEKEVWHVVSQENEVVIDPAGREKLVGDMQVTRKEFTSAAAIFCGDDSSEVPF